MAHTAQLAHQGERGVQGTQPRRGFQGTQPRRGVQWTQPRRGVQRTHPRGGITTSVRGPRTHPCKDKQGATNEACATAQRSLSTRTCRPWHAENARPYTPLASAHFSATSDRTLVRHGTKEGQRRKTVCLSHNGYINLHLYIHIYTYTFISLSIYMY